ncbi:Acyl-coenzyme A:6-aminopenicillanic acid acyl-transferase [Chromobacterium violaceum]|uniref:Acyl-coenzyme A:6-aminopenicillanic acid acyl-transferase n=1 Tax=Chromobacterium violaceum TaxID=536 RepID=A0A3S4I6Z3_CHRVL|nr:Acyl-coenzyme A:6-aminopenicillanic acid acyl-transferase [Chromobacterium violaceum]
MTRLLRDYGSLDEVASAADKLFAQARPVFLLLADAGGLMQVEIGQHGRYRLIRQQSGTLAHTNHYADTSLLDGAQTIGPSSQARLERIRFLLDQHPAHTLPEFERLSRDRHDGPDNSLWRSGREHTLAGWRIALPAGAPPRLQLTLANPGARSGTGIMRWMRRSGAAGAHAIAVSGQKTGVAGLSFENDAWRAQRAGVQFGPSHLPSLLRVTPGPASGSPAAWACRRSGSR